MAIVLDVVMDPYAYCGRCGDCVEWRTSGRNMPCGCAAEVVSVCPTYDQFTGCRCDPETVTHAADQAKAEALQEALEEQERCLREGLPVMVLPADSEIPQLELEQLAAAIRSTNPSAVRILNLRDLHSTPPLGDEVIEQADRLRGPLVVAALAVLLVAGLAVWWFGGPW